MINDPSRRISACSRPTALLAASSDRNELEQTNSANEELRWVSVILTGRISCRTTRTPALATCQAASEPARPAPMIFTDSDGDLMPVIGTEVARSAGYDNARARRALSVPQVAEDGSAVIGAGGNARNVRA